MPLATQENEFRDAWRAVTNSKLNEFRFQCTRLAELARQGVVDKIDAIDTLHTIAIAHALIRALGADYVEEIIAQAFAGSDLGGIA